MQRRAASFIAPIGASTGSEPPRFITREFDALLGVGHLAHWFQRLGCGK